LKKSLSTYLCFALAAVAASSGVLAHHYRSRVKKAEATLAKEMGKSAAEKVVKLSHQERAYLRALGERYGIQPKEAEPCRDAIHLAARMNAQLNLTAPPEYSTAKTPWLLPPPKTLASRDIPAARTTEFSLADGKIDLPEQPVHFQYAVTNTTAAAVPMPIIYSSVRWDDAEKMVQSAGLRDIADELDRAVAIWRFVALNRYHAKPVTEGAEEHDTVKFFACYGYGFCDDASQAVAGLAKLCGMEVRIWGLEGHVVPEIFAAGRWRLLDADFAAYFHKPGAPREILGVEELSKDRDAFKHAVQIGKMGAFEQGYAEFFLTAADNKPWPVEARSEHTIRAKLAPGERVVFSNFNWGEYFVGAFPQRVSRYFNGYFERPIGPDSFKVPENMQIRRDGDSFTIVNLARRDKRAEIHIESPFPIVGGSIVSPIPVNLEFTDSVEERKFILPTGRDISFTSVVNRVTKQPTTRFVIGVVVPAGGMLKFETPLRVISHFQFAELPLLRIKNGTTEFKTYVPEGASLSGLKGEVRWK
jgi:hypothetical protein